MISVNLERDELQPAQFVIEAVLGAVWREIGLYETTQLRDRRQQIVQELLPEAQVSGEFSRSVDQLASYNQQILDASDLTQRRELLESGVDASKQAGNLLKSKIDPKAQYAQLNRRSTLDLLVQLETLAKLSVQTGPSRDFDWLVSQISSMGKDAVEQGDRVLADAALKSLGVVQGTVVGEEQEKVKVQLDTLKELVARKRPPG